MGRYKTSHAKSRGYRPPKAPHPSAYQRGGKKTTQQKFEKWLAKLKAEQIDTPVPPPAKDLRGGEL